MTTWFFLCNLWLLISAYPSYVRFRFAALRVRSVQEEKLQKILRKNSNSDFGCRFGFSSVHSINDFQNTLPFSDYRDYQNDIERIARGEQGVLTTENVILLEPTSGSTAVSKLIPYTEGLKREFRAGIFPWIFDLYLRYPKMLFGQSYWSLSPAASRHLSGSPVPIGFDDDASYLGISKFFLQQLFAVPSSVSQIQDIEVFRYVTLFFLLKAKSLTFVSVWHPSFFTLLLDALADWKDLLVHDIAQGKISAQPGHELPDFQVHADRQRAFELDSIFSRSTNYFEQIWPQLQIISCWGDTLAQDYVQILRSYFPRAIIQKKGLLATEGFISFPFGDAHQSTLSLRSHFFEFIDNENGKVELAHRLENGKIYSVVITTSGGLYRYRLNDLVEVVGHEKQCPLIRFVGKADQVVDVFGEKLNEQHVSSVLRELFERHHIPATFFLVALEPGSPPAYCLFIEFGQTDSGKLRSLVRDVEGKLQENFHYRHCRRLGQLGELKLFLIVPKDEPAVATYLRICRSSGQRYGGIKPTVLSRYQGWSKEFHGRFVV